jgi:hypothetical protein
MSIVTTAATSTQPSAISQSQTAISSLNLPQPSNNPLIVNKKEKQRPETWNKIEQQIFFNALRQVIIC